MLKLWAKYKSMEGGATAIEYGLIAAGIAVAISVVVYTMGDQLLAMFTDVSSKLEVGTSG